MLATAAIALMAAPALADEYGDYLFVPFSGQRGTELEQKCQDNVELILHFYHSDNSPATCIGAGGSFTCDH